METSPKVFIATPVYSGEVCYQYVDSLVATMAECAAKGIRVQYQFMPGCCYVELARNVLIHKFLESDATDLLFVDADMGWDAAKVPALINLPQDIVCGAYPYKQDTEDYPVLIETNEDGIPKGISTPAPLIKAGGAPTGFMRIKRKALELMIEKYPETLVRRKDNAGKDDGEYYHLFRCEQLGDGWLGEDYNFCRMFRLAGGEVWVYPDIEFVHVGRKAWRGNYDKFMRRQPGGIDAKE